MISVCILTLGRETIYQTLETVFLQEADFEYEIVIILQGEITTSKIDALNKNNIKYHVHSYPHGLGFGFYRNKSIEHSLGDILVWIDDDEWPLNRKWLHYLSHPLRRGDFSVSTGGCRISLGQGYFRDCISLLGYPGGGALGFQKVWRVDGNSCTKHLCGGNFAITRNTLDEINNFEEKCIYSCDDTHLAGKINKKGIDIYYQPKADIGHVTRDLKSFYSWLKIRKKGIQDYRQIKNNEHLFSDKIFHLKNIFIGVFRRFQFLPGVLYLFLVILFFIIVD